MAEEINGNGYELNGNGYTNGNGNGNEHHEKHIVPKAESFLIKPFAMERFFTQEGKNPFVYDYNGKPINWISEDVSVTDDKGKVIFTQHNVKRPDFWSPLAIKVVASKYFWGDQAKGERENNIILIPIAGDLNLNIVNLQERIYNVTYYPSVIIDEKYVLEGFKSKSDTEKYLT